MRVLIISIACIWKDLKLRESNGKSILTLGGAIRRLTRMIYRILTGKYINLSFELDLPSITGLCVFTKILIYTDNQRSDIVF